jgi:phosphatidylinositol alpha-mannosyltransferase
MPLMHHDTSVKPFLREARLSLRVCIVIPYDLADKAGGVKHHAVQLARALRRQGHNVTVFGPSSSPSDDGETVGIRGMVNVAANGSDNRMAVLASPAELRRFFRDGAFDVVHVHEPPIPAISYWAAWLTPGVPKMGTFHAYSESLPVGLRIMQQFGAALQYSFFDHAVAVSPPAARHAGKAWKRLLPVVPNGIALDVFTPVLRSASTTAHRARRLLAIGRLADERKGIATMIEAFRVLRASSESWVLDVVGDDPASPLLPRVPGLTYHPPLALRRLVERYRDCDVFVAPSTGQESFGIVLLEAMATGKPIVCSDIEGYRHVADPAGAAFVPPNDPRALAATLDALIVDEPRRRAMSAFNLAYVRRFGWPSIARDVVREYLVTIENHRARAGLAPLGLLGHWPRWRAESIAIETLGHPGSEQARAEKIGPGVGGG